MNDKNVFITGATDGIGRATARILAERGANLFVLCRNPVKGEALRDELLSRRPGATVRLFLADLGDLRQVRRAADEFLNLNMPLDVLINNAAVLNTSRVILPNGVEQMFAVNHLGHFLLTNLLLPALDAAEAARIVVVASDAYKFCGGIEFDNLSWETGFRTFKVYGHSKLANILHMRALAERLRGSTVAVNALHPGGVSTNLGLQNSGWAKYLQKLLAPFLSSADEGAQTSVYLASAPELAGVSGEYFADCRPHETRALAKDMQQAERLWQVSESLIAQ